MTRKSWPDRSRENRAKTLGQGDWGKEPFAWDSSDLGRGQCVGAESLVLEHSTHCQPPPTAQNLNPNDWKLLGSLLSACVLSTT